MVSKACKYLSFDALKGLKEVMVDADSYTTKRKYPNLSEEQQSDMDILLYKSYLRKEAIHISYYNNKGEIVDIDDCILNIDVVTHKLKLLANKPIYMAQIVSLKEIDK